VEKTAIDNVLEKQILTAMIIDETFLGRIQGIYSSDLFVTPYAKLVSKWCVDYFREYKQAPKKNIENIFLEYSEKIQDKAIIELVSYFLECLNDDVKEINTEYLIDQAEKHFNKIKLEKMLKDAENAMSLGKPEKAQEIVSEHSTVAISQAAGLFPFSEEAMTMAFSATAAPLFTYTGAFGHFINEQLVPDSFISIMGSEKKGKSFWLMEFGMRALIQGNKVAYFEVGDMSAPQILRRMNGWMAKLPMKEGIYPIPISIDRAGGEVAIEHDLVEYPYGITHVNAKDVIVKTVEKTGVSPDLCKLSCHSNGSINVSGIRSILKTWEANEGFVPTVIIIDYADILAPESGRGEKRDQIDETWRALRRLSQDYHTCLITATQTDAKAYEQEMITMSNFSDCKNKLSHVTGTIGLCQTEEEKTQGIMRLNWVTRREGESYVSKFVYVAQALSICRPIMRSCY
jgi:replicative DNA helicase